MGDSVSCVSLASSDVLYVGRSFVVWDSLTCLTTHQMPGKFAILTTCSQIRRLIRNKLDYRLLNGGSDEEAR